MDVQFHGGKPTRHLDNLTNEDVLREINQALHDQTVAEVRVYPQKEHIYVNRRDRRKAAKLERQAKSRRH